MTIYSCQVGEALCQTVVKSAVALQINLTHSTAVVKSAVAIQLERVKHNAQATCPARRCRPLDALSTCSLKGGSMKRLIQLVSC
jgi:hypothetical protein